MNRMFSVALVVAILVSFGASVVSAQSASRTGVTGAGTANDPYLISNKVSYMTVMADRNNPVYARCQLPNGVWRTTTGRLNPAKTTSIREVFCTELGDVQDMESLVVLNYQDKGEGKLPVFELVRLLK